MPRSNRKNSGQRRRRGGGGGRQALPYSTVVSVVTASAGNVKSNKTFTVAQLLPDIGGPRPVVIKKITVDFQNASAASPGASAQIRSFAGPFSQDAIPFASSQMRGLNATVSTRLTLVPKFAGQFVPISDSSVNTVLQIELWSQSVATFQVCITTHFVLTADPAVSAIA